MAHPGLRPRIGPSSSGSTCRPAAAPLPLRVEDVDAAVEHAPTQRDVVFLPLQLEDLLAQLVVGERGEVGLGIVVVVGQRAGALEDRPLERRRRRDLERPCLDLVAQPAHPLLAAGVDPPVKRPAPCGDGVRLVLGRAQQALELVVVGRCEIGEQVHSAGHLS